MLPSYMLRYTLSKHPTSMLQWLAFPRATPHILKQARPSVIRSCFDARAVRPFASQSFPTYSTNSTSGSSHKRSKFATLDGKFYFLSVLFMSYLLGKYMTYKIAKSYWLPGNKIAGALVICVGETIRDHNGVERPLADNDIRPVVETLVGCMSRHGDLHIRYCDDGKLPEPISDYDTKDIVVIVARDKGVENASNFQDWLAANVAVQLALMDTDLRKLAGSHLSILLWAWENGRRSNDQIPSKAFLKFASWVHELRVTRYMVHAQQLDNSSRRLLRKAGYNDRFLPDLPNTVKWVVEKLRNSPPTSRKWDASTAAAIGSMLWVFCLPCLIQLSSSPQSKWEFFHAQWLPFEEPLEKFLQGLPDLTYDHEVVDEATRLNMIYRFGKKGTEFSCDVDVKDADSDTK